MPDLNFEQFGSFAIVFILMSIAIIALYRELIKERKKSDDIQEKYLAYAKEVNDNLKGPLSEQARITGLIYDILLKNKAG